MPIRLRKIASDEKSLLQITKRVEQHRTLWRRTRFLVVLLVLAGSVGFVIYARFYRLSGAVLVVANQDLLSSPGEVTVRWLTPKPAGTPVVAGEPLARLKLRSGNLLIRQAELVERQLERQRTAVAVAEAIATLEHHRKNLAQEETELETAAAVATDAFARGQVASGKANTILAARRQEMDHARQLRLLDALTENDYLGVVRLAAVAEADQQRAILYEKSLAAELAGARQCLLRFQHGRDEQLRALEVSLAEVRQLLQELEVAIATAEATLAGRGQELVLAAPSDGLMLQPYCTVGQMLHQGQEVISTYQPGSTRLVAYLQERFRDQLTPGRRARVRLGQDLITTTVFAVHPALVLPPAELRRRRLLPKNTYFYTVEMDLTPDARPHLPGETGRVVFP